MRVAASGESRQPNPELRNVDGLLLLPDLGLYAVADSVGRSSWTRTPAQRALDGLARAVEEASSLAFAKIGAALETACLELNRRMVEEGTRDPELKGATTLTACLLGEGSAWMVHLGDSAAWLLRGKTLTRLTMEETVPQVLLKSGSITRAQALRHPLRNHLVNALGSPHAGRPTVWEQMVAPGDLLILATDGVARGLGKKGLLGQLQAARQAGLELAPCLVEAAVRAGVEDDLTALVLELAS